MTSDATRFAAPIGRFLLAWIFFASALAKLSNWQQPAQMMAEKGVPAVDALLSIAVALEIIGAVLVILGWHARWGAACLLLFLICVTPVMHNFWTLEDPQKTEQMINFMKNVSIFGGLLLVVAFGPGAFSIDNRQRAKPAAPSA